MCMLGFSPQFPLCNQKRPLHPATDIATSNAMPVCFFAVTCPFDLMFSVSLLIAFTPQVTLACNCLYCSIRFSVSSVDSSHCPGYWASLMLDEIPGGMVMRRQLTPSNCQLPARDPWRHFSRDISLHFSPPILTRLVWFKRCIFCSIKYDRDVRCFYDVVIQSM